MRQAAILFVVFALAFGAAFWLFGGVSRPDLLTGPGYGSRPPERAGPNEELSGTVGRGGRGAPVAPSGPKSSGGADFPAEARKDLGVIHGVFDRPEGLKISTVTARLSPPAGALWKCDFEGFVFIDVPPGAYHVEIEAHGTVPTTVPYVAVVAGETSRVRATLEPGISVAGVVVEGVSQAPVADAVVFLGTLQLRTSATGSFKAPVLLPARVLEQITVVHPDFDRLTTRPGLIQDTLDVRLALSRGEGHLVGRFVLGEGSAAKAPATAIVRLVRVIEAQTELRREIVVRDAVDFEIKGVVPDAYRVEAEFPGSGLPVRYAEVDLRVEPIQAIEIPLAGGAKLAGGVFRNGATFGPAELQLVDAAGRLYGKTTTKSDGKFVFEGVLPGRYAVRFLSRIPFLQTDAFDVVDATARTLELDYDLGRVALK